jgi:hypothetical protein
MLWMETLMKRRATSYFLLVFLTTKENISGNRVHLVAAFLPFRNGLRCYDCGGGADYLLLKVPRDSPFYFSPNCLECVCLPIEPLRSPPLGLSMKEETYQKQRICNCCSLPAIPPLRSYQTQSSFEKRQEECASALFGAQLPRMNLPQAESEMGLSPVMERPKSFGSTEALF